MNFSQGFSNYTLSFLDFVSKSRCVHCTAQKVLGADPDNLRVCGGPMTMGGARAAVWLFPIIIASSYALFIRARPETILTQTIVRHHTWLHCNFVLFLATCLMSMWATAYNVNDKVSAEFEFLRSFPGSFCFAVLCIAARVE